MTDEFNHLLDRLEISISSMRRFTADASHELRTPITILRTGLEVALRKERTAGEYREVLQENLIEIDRIQRIVEGLLTLAKADSSDEPQIQTSRVDLSAVTEEVVATATAMAHESDIHIQTDLVSGQWVDADQNLLRLMLLNLLDNAVKFSPQQGTIHLFLRPDGDRVRLRVQDEGPGVEPADRDRIFERFYRGGGSRASGTGAGGLGLSVVSWVVESHGGSIRLLDPDTPGATFEVELPKASA